MIGASSGLGFAVANRLAEEGAAVAVSARDQSCLVDAAGQIGGRPVPLDVAANLDTVNAAVREVVDMLNGLDIVVFNHGRPLSGSVADISSAQFESAFRLMLASAFNVTKAVLPELQRSPAGVIAYVTSSSTKEILPNLMLSNVMRQGVVGLMKSVAAEFGPMGLRSICVAPGRFATKAALARTGGLTEDSTIPLGRLGRPNEFADTVAYLCSSRAAYITGCSIVVDGGRLRAVNA